MLEWIGIFVVLYLAIGWATASFLWRRYYYEVCTKDFALELGLVWPLTLLFWFLFFAAGALATAFEWICERFPL